MSKPRKIRREKRPSSKGGLQLVVHPMHQLPPEAIKAALLSMADKRIESFPKLIDSILEIFRRADPLHILAVIASYGLHVGVSDEGVQKRSTLKIEQHHVEILQALALTLPEGDWGQMPASPEDMQSVIDTVTDLVEAFHFRRLKVMETEADPQTRAVLSLQERLRLHTQAVRNWGAYIQVIQISRELYSALDSQFESALGFTTTALISISALIVKGLEQRSRDRRNWLHRVFREHQIPRIARAYCKHHPSLKGTADDILKAIPAGATREQVLAMLISHADLLLPEAAQVSIDEVARLSGYDHIIIRRVLDVLSLQPGALKNENIEHMFMGNPIWVRPIIALGLDYFAVIPQGIFSQIHRIMRSIAETAGMSAQLEKRRADYLEGKVAQMLAGAFPTATLRNGTKWRIDTDEYETDHFVAIDTTVLIVEDKSAALTEPALRGAPDRVRRHVQELIADPSEQSARLETQIWLAASGDGAAGATLAPFAVDFANVENVVRLSVTLDDFSVLSSSELDLKEAGWIRADLALAPTLNIADFESTIEILERPCFLVHYFAERQRVQKDGQIFAHEMDFLGCYLENGLNMGNLEEQKLTVSLVGMSALIDDYYTGIDVGIPLPKPRPKLTPYIATLVETIEKKAIKRWTVVTTDLLRCATYEDQRRLEKRLNELKLKVERNWRDPKHECSLVARSHALGKAAVIFFVYPPQLAERRKEIAEEIALQVFDAGETSRCVLVARNTARWTDPYASVSIMTQKKDGTAPDILSS